MIVRSFDDTDAFKVISSAGWWVLCLNRDVLPIKRKQQLTGANGMPKFCMPLLSSDLLVM